MWYTDYNARRRGSSGSLNRQSAIAGLNAFPDGSYGRMRAVRNVDIKVLCNVNPRTVSGRGRSSTKRCFACAIRKL